MKQKAITFLALLCLYTNSISAQATKHAVIFAIGNYPPSGGWPMIASLSDIPYITKILEQQGFPAKRISVYTDTAVTPAGIEKAFFKLYKEVKKGDVVLVYFCTHGEQIEDDNRDETDGLDESIVTYHAVVPDRFGHATNFKLSQKEYVRDDQIGIYLDRLRDSLGPLGDVAVFLDLCNSGSATRGNPVRGNKPPLVTSTFDATKYSKDTESLFSNKKSTDKPDDKRSPYVVFSASRAEEPASETRDDNNRFIGSLTYSFHKAIRQSLNSSTYRNLFSQIQAVMNDKVPGQHPVLEGDGIDRQLFGGKFISQEPFVEIKDIQSKELILGAGIDRGLREGTAVYVYDAHTIDPKRSTALDSGVITRSALFQSVAILKKGLRFTQPSLGRVFFTPNYDIKPVSVGFSGYSASEEAGIRAGLKNFKLLTFNNDPELIIRKGNTADSILVSSNFYTFDLIPGGLKDTTSLYQKVRNYAQHKFLQNLEIKDSSITIEVKLMPLVNGKPDTSFLNKTVMGVQEFNVGDKFVLWIKNPCPDPVYFNILDMQPDGVINAVLPNRRQRIYAQDLVLAGNTARIFDKYILTVGPPVGTETYKIFASTDPIDLEIIATSKGAQTRGGFGALEKLVKESYEIATRGTIGERIGQADGSCYNLTFVIKPK